VKLVWKGAKFCTKVPSVLKNGAFLAFFDFALYRILMSHSFAKFPINSWISSRSCKMGSTTISGSNEKFSIRNFRARTRISSVSSRRMSHFLNGRPQTDLYKTKAFGVPVLWTERVQPNLRGFWRSPINREFSLEWTNWIVSCS